MKSSHVLRRIGALTEVGRIVRYRTVQPKAPHIRHNVGAIALVHTLAASHDVHVIEHGEDLCRRRVYRTDDGAAAVGDALEQLHALRAGQIVQAAGKKSNVFYLLFVQLLQNMNSKVLII